MVTWWYFQKQCSAINTQQNVTYKLQYKIFLSFRCVTLNQPGVVMGAVQTVCHTVQLKIYEGNICVKAVCEEKNDKKYIEESSV